MELIIYNRTNTSGTRTGAKTINVSHHGGHFSFSSELAKFLGIKQGSRVTLANDKKNNKNWFVCVSDTDESGFVVSKSDTSLLFRNQYLARKVLSSFKEQKSIRFLVSEETTEVQDQIFYQLIPITKTNK